MGRNLINGLIALTTLSLLPACQKATDTVVAAAASKSVYVASGSCYSGSGITTYSLAADASRSVTKWSADTGASEGVFTDLNSGTYVSVGTMPQSLIDRGDHILMLTENAGATSMGDRKLFKILKNNPGTYRTYANFAYLNTASNITRSMAIDVDDTISFSKSIAVERINTLGARIGSVPYVNPAAITGNCFPAIPTQITQIALMAPYTSTNQGKLIFIHSGATAATNRIGIVQRTGLTTAVAADCVTSSPAGGFSTVAHTNALNLTGPVTLLGGTGGVGPSLTSMVYIPTAAPALTAGKLIVSYSAATAGAAFDNNTQFNHGIVMYDITETGDIGIGTATITNPVIIWRDESIVYAASTMTYDSTTNSLYVAVGGSPSLANQMTQNYGYNVEKFTLDIATPKLTRVSANNQPFIAGNVNTKCISSMIIGD